MRITVNQLGAENYVDIKRGTLVMFTKEYLHKNDLGALPPHPFGHPSPLGQGQALLRNQPGHFYWLIALLQYIPFKPYGNRMENNCTQENRFVFSIGR